MAVKLLQTVKAPTPLEEAAHVAIEGQRGGGLRGAGGEHKGSKGDGELHGQTFQKRASGARFSGACAGRGHPGITG